MIYHEAHYFVRLPFAICTVTPPANDQSPDSTPHNSSLSSSIALIARQSAVMRETQLSTGLNQSLRYTLS